MEIEARIEEALEYMQNDTHYALELFNGILKEDPNNISALNGKGSTLMKLHQSEEALKLFDCSLSIEENSSAYLNKGIICKNNEDYKNALICFDKALDYNPRLASIVSMLKNEILERVNLDSADLDSLYDFTKEANSLIKEAINYKNQNKLWDALDSLEKAIEEDPRCKNSVNDLIEKVKKNLQREFLYKETNSNTATKKEKKTNSKKKKISKLKTLTYRSITVENNPHKALSLINKIFEINYDDLDAINLQGITYFSLNEYDKSIESFDKCLSINEDYTCALFNKGLVLRRLGFLKESLECFDKAWKNPNHYQKIKPYQEEALNKLKRYE